VTDAPIGAAEDWVRSWTASASERAAAAQSLSDQVSRLSVSASDPDDIRATARDYTGSDDRTADVFRGGY
jgi:hypothetical protein